MISVNPTWNVLRHSLGRLPFLNTVSRRILSAGGSVFVFHHVLPRIEECYEPEMITSTEAFADFLDWLSENYRVVSLDLLVSQRTKTIDRKKPVCAITFDDGWRDTFIHAFPLLKATGFTATIFLPVRFIGTNRRFWEERLSLVSNKIRRLELRRALIEESARLFPWFPPAYDWFSSEGQLKRFLMTRPSEEAEEFVQLLAETARLDVPSSDRAFMNWDEVREMQGMGISFGSHTLNHTLSPNAEAPKSIHEVRQSREELKERLGIEIKAFSYPDGATSHLTKDVVRRAGYEYAVTTRPGLIYGTVDQWLIPRLTVNDPILGEGATCFVPNKARFWFAKSVLQTKFASCLARSSTKSSERKKIVFLIDQISGWEGGTERQLHAIIRALDRNSFDPELWMLFDTGRVPENTMPCPARWICPDATSSSLTGRIFRLWRLMREVQPQIVQTFFIEGIFAGILAARLARIQMIVGSARNAGHWKRRRHKAAFQAVAGLAHRWQCNSRAVWEYARKTEGVSPECIDILPNAIDLSHFTPATLDERLRARRRLGLDCEGPMFVCVANLTTVKDHATLLAASKLLQSELPRAQFLLVGEGPLRRDLELQRDKLGLRESVHFAGRQADVRPCLAAADFCILTSRSEGSSNSVLEYMAMGLPSVVSDIPPNRELVKGLFFAPGDAIDLSRKLMMLWQDGKLCDDLRSEYARTVSQYSQDRFILRVQNYYNRLVT
jgi:glycosyltransferase involved in cell wall biosynthesis